jgi:peroxiredoxin
MGAPTVTLLENSDTGVVVHTVVMVRYYADDKSLELPSFLRGEFQTAIGVKEVSSPSGKSIDVVLAGKAGNVKFVPNWVSPAWDSEPDQLAAINKAALNSMTSSFEPSNTPLPGNILNLKFKTLAGDLPALAMMMDLPGGNPSGPPDLNSVWNVFLQDGDDFAFAISEEFVQAMFGRSVDNLRQWGFSFWYQIDIKVPNPFSIIGIGDDSYTIKVATITFTVSVDSVTIALQNGQILVTVTGSANTDTPGIPKFTFTGTQAFTLELIDSHAWGSTADLVPLGDPTVNASAPGIPDWAINNYFTPTATNKFKSAVANFLNGVNPGLQAKFSARQNLGNFLSQLMNPTPKPGDAPVKRIDPTLSYTSFEISPSGIVLHGSLAVPPWPKPHVEFSYRVVPGYGPLPLASGEYNALRSWIPGGTQQEFIWNQQDGPPLRDDKHTFFFHEKPGAEQIIHLCLTVNGTRITASGPVAYTPVTGTSFCSWRSHIFLHTSAVARLHPRLPKLALTQKARSGGLEVIGHVSPWAPAGTSPEYTSNLVVHFPDQESLAGLESLRQGLRDSGRTDTATALLVALTPEQLAHAGAADGVAYSDDADAWAEFFGGVHRPATFLLDREGKTVWHHNGPLSLSDLAEALRHRLVAGGTVASGLMLSSEVRIGQPTPNFLFESSPGREMTLRRLIGRAVVLVFWNSTSQASLETLRDVESAFANAGDQAPVVLAINDGDTNDAAIRIAAESGIAAAMVVPDPAREIALAYGVTVWPTVIFLDSNGLVSAIRHGRFATELARPPSGMSAAD